MSFIWNKKPWAIVTGVSSFLLTLMLVGTHYANTYATMINKALNVSTSRVVETEDSSEEDTEYYKSRFDDDESLTTWQQELNEQIQGEGSVLIENKNGALPVEKGIGVSTFGRSSSDIIYGGTGSGQVDTTNAATMQSALTAAGFNVNTGLLDWYSEQISSLTNDRSTGGMWTEIEDVGSSTTLAEIPYTDLADAVTAGEVSYSGYDDLAIITIGRSGGEGSDLPAGTFNDGTSYFEIQEVERELVEYVTEDLDFDTVVVLINSSNAMALDWLDEYDIDAALWIGGPGQYGMNSVAKILCGDINPSGRFVDTYSKSSLSSPAMQNFGGYTYANADVDSSTGAYTGTIAGNTIDGAPEDNTSVRYAIHYLVEQENIYVGYKYYETRYEDTVLGQGSADGSAGIYTSTGTSWNYAEEVDYAFGYGLSYTTFTQELVGDPTYDASTDSYTVKVNVTNTGTVAGKEVVQVYAQQPYTDFDRDNGIEKSAIQLVGIGKTSTLAAGDSEEVEVTVERKELTSYDSKVNETYILEQGTYYLAIGSDAHDALNNVLAKKAQSELNNVDTTKMTSTGDPTKAYDFYVGVTDTTSYAYSEVNTGTKIENQFDSADLNYYGENLVTYLTRNNWQGTFPTSYDTLYATDELIKDLNFNYEEETEGESGVTLNSTATSYNVVMMNGLDYDDELWDDLLSQMSLEEMAEVIGHSGYGAEAIESVGLPSTAQNDGPQGIKGTTNNVATVAYTSEPVMASTFNLDILYNIGLSMGEDAMRIDGSPLNGWYGPAMNIHRTPYSGRNFEYYSEDGFLSGIMAAQEVKGAQEMGLVCFIKHFALNDFETYRQSVATFATEQSIREIWLKSFEYAVKDGGATGAMSSFNRIGARWAGAHSGLLTNVLREEWGFNGIVLTDAVMQNRNWMDVSIGLEAGNDAWLSSNNWLVDILVQRASTDNKILRNMVNACHNILYAYANSTAINGLSSTSRVVKITPAWQIAVYVVDGVLGVVAVGAAILLVLAELKARKIL